MMPGSKIVLSREISSNQQNSALTVETDQPEDPAVGTKRARIMPGLKIVLPREISSNQQNSASTVETDQPEDPAVGTKRARIMPGSKIVLPSSNVEEYSGLILRGTIAGIVNPKGTCVCL